MERKKVSKGQSPYPVDNNHLEIYRLYIEWLITPPHERESGIANNKQFAEHYKIPIRTVYNWGEKKETIDFLKEHWEKTLEYKNNQVKSALYAKSVAGDAKAMTLWARWIDKMEDIIKADITFNPDDAIKAVLSAKKANNDNNT